MSQFDEVPGDLAETRPNHPDPSLEAYQPIRLSLTPEISPVQPGPPAQPVLPTGCLWPILASLAVLLAYFFLPVRTNLLILGVDSGLARGELGRTDTLVLTTFSPLKPYIGMLSFPRDLWVQIPGVGGGLQLTAALVLTELFSIPLEAATSFAISLWVINFVVIIPFGLLLALREGVHWSKLKEIGQEDLR